MTVMTCHDSHSRVPLTGPVQLELDTMDEEELLARLGLEALAPCYRCWLGKAGGRGA